MSSTKVKAAIGGKDLTLEYGRFSEQANAAILVSYGDTVVHVTAVMGKSDTTLSYFPLSVDFAEKLYAGGKIKGSRWVKRDGRPSDEAILKGRIIDRSIRPLFPKNVKRDVQIIATVLSADGANDADMLGLVGTSSALHVSNIPWDGPIAGIRVGMIEGAFVANPTYEQRASSSLDLIVSGSKEAIVMVEAGANEVSEEDMLKALEFAHGEIKKIVTVIEDFREKIGKPKLEFPTVEIIPAALKAEITNKVRPDIAKRLGVPGCEDGLVEDFVAALEDSYAEQLDSRQLGEIIHDVLGEETRAKTINTGIRIDGRKTVDIRPLEAEVDILPRPHGSAMFKRGQTQVLSIATLGAPSLGQILETMEDEKVKHYIHHYAMPPYASGETGRFGAPGRREIGHGALAERAIVPMLPSELDFPYTIQVVSEVMSSNGSTSQASVCGSCMALMAAGVPLKKPVAGIAMGLMTDGKKSVVLTDIAGIEDHVGDMDFKVAGTRDGITALQMDIKVSGISFEVLTQALAQAKDARMEIMKVMLKAIPEPRKELSKYAPKIVQFEIPNDKIGEVIGPGGKHIKQIMADCGVQVDIDDATGVGKVTVSGVDPVGMDKAVNWIKGMVHVPEAGEEYDGKVTRVEGYGCFVEFLPGKQGLVHVSRMSAEYVQDAGSLVKEGDSVHVWVKGVDDMGRTDLSMVPLDQLKPDAPRPPRSNDFGGPRRGGFGGRSGDRGGFRPRR
ncbi:MAG: Polyribonucleotide nucleotidyltransferase [Microgenomates group bacterium GW2011_GWB1_46_7]|nr:MAG: Polyribonucleotide nucleotidyltransferase [Microgenomates group bacterium GW2011_GWB1_46_7]